MMSKKFQVILMSFSMTVIIALSFIIVWDAKQKKAAGESSTAEQKSERIN